MEGNLTIEDEGIRGILEIPSSLTDLDFLNASNHPRNEKTVVRSLNTTAMPLVVCIVID